MTAQPNTMQDLGHPAGHDYQVGSPHLTHPQLRSWVVDTLQSLVREQFARHGRARVLEIGAGHGAFTDHLLAVGASVTVTEMSPSSFELLSERYSSNPAARVLFDERGDVASGLGEAFDLVVCVSVLHHIPDYLSAIDSWADLTTPGGTFASFQDPMFYPRRSRLNLATDRGAYFLWRSKRGHVVEGLRTRIRRIRKTYDETNPHDMVEYHVMRQGCDEVAISELLQSRFASVQVHPYWSTQSGLFQSLGERLGVHSTFAIVARDRIAEQAVTGSAELA